MTLTNNHTQNSHRQTMETPQKYRNLSSTCNPSTRLVDSHVMRSPSTDYLRSPAQVMLKLVRNAIQGEGQDNEKENIQTKHPKKRQNQDRRNFIKSFPDQYFEACIITSAEERSSLHRESPKYSLSLSLSLYMYTSHNAV